MFIAFLVLKYKPQSEFFVDTADTCTSVRGFENASPLFHVFLATVGTIDQPAFLLFMKRPRAVGISFNFMQDCGGTQVTSYQHNPYHMNFTYKLFVVQICNELVPFMTFVCVSSIFELTRFAIIDNFDCVIRQLM